MHEWFDHLSLDQQNIKYTDDQSVVFRCTRHCFVQSAEDLNLKFAASAKIVLSVLHKESSRLQHTETCTLENNEMLTKEIPSKETEKIAAPSSRFHIPNWHKKYCLFKMKLLSYLHFIIFHSSRFSIVTCSVSLSLSYLFLVSSAHIIKFICSTCRQQFESKTHTQTPKGASGQVLI